MLPAKWFSTRSCHYFIFATCTFCYNFKSRKMFPQPYKLFCKYGYKPKCSLYFKQVAIPFVLVSCAFEAIQVTTQLSSKRYSKCYISASVRVSNLFCKNSELSNLNLNLKTKTNQTKNPTQTKPSISHCYLWGWPKVLLSVAGPLQRFCPGYCLAEQEEAAFAHCDALWLCFHPACALLFVSLHNTTHTNKEQGSLKSDFLLKGGRRLTIPFIFGALAVCAV